MVTLKDAMQIYNSNHNVRLQSILSQEEAYKNDVLMTISSDPEGDVLPG